MILANGSKHKPGCPCCRCCCTVSRQLRGFNFTTGVWACSPATTLTKTVNGSSSDWTSGTFKVCFEDTLAVSGFPETRSCGGDTYTFASATLRVYCNGNLIEKDQIEVYTGTLSYDLTACPCAVTDGDCEILIDAVYTFGTATSCATLRAQGFHSYGLRGNPPVCTQLGCFGTPIVPFLELSYPDIFGYTLIDFTTHPGDGSNFGLPCSIVGKTLTVTVGGIRGCTGSAFDYDSTVYGARWFLNSVCSIGGPTKSWVVTNGGTMLVNAYFSDVAAPCQGSNPCP